MINDNLIELLVNLLEDNETLSDYSLEYAIALFMNLTLKNAGKKKCADDFKKTLKVISELLGNSNTEVKLLLIFH
jgi:LisH domain-containing protein ARMC9